MHKTFLKTVLCRGIRHSCQPDQALLKYVHFHRVEASHEDIDAHVVLVAS